LLIKLTNLTPLIPLSLKGEGEEKKEGLTPLLTHLKTIVYQEEMSYASLNTPLGEHPSRSWCLCPS